MLEIARDNISRGKFSCKFEFVKLESQVPFRLPLETNMADIITMNSVLHHVRDTETFLKEVDRVLRPSGMILIAHEPNRYFKESGFVLCSYRFLKYLLPSKDTIYQLLVCTHTKGIACFLYSRLKKDNIFAHNEKETEAINVVLLEEKLTSKPLSPDEIVRITDVKAREGFKPDKILPHYKRLYEETYDHLCSVETEHYDNLIIRKYSDWLKNRFPKSGYFFFIVLRKPEAETSLSRQSPGAPNCCGKTWWLTETPQLI